ALPTQRGRRGQGPDGLSGAGVAGHTERVVDVEAADHGDGAAVHRTPSERSTKVTGTRAGPVSRPSMSSTRPATPRRPIACASLRTALIGGWENSNHSRSS